MNNTHRRADANSVSRRRPIGGIGEPGQDRDWTAASSSMITS